MNEMIARVAAAQATLDQWKGKPFKLGRADCVRVAASHLRRMGHRVKLPPAGSYATARSALKALKNRGFSTLVEAMDGAGFDRIAPAAALPGDIVALPDDMGIGCLTVAMSNGRVAGFHQDTIGLEVLQPSQYVAAWRVSLGVKPGR
ncbi:DUF6950 family protein [Sphingomonas yantingensis]|uniref:DUF6950 domain-containing protein n=1 Tax=Sphingomonas yantingensis TaxID=1241761 RepID=A0A7W9EGD5_9SPHN|nr:hypothetical protein [Sphingomonas yantingensis]MBB5697003.1 hypothetical protein [Sphingomonas yantingensis]